MAAARVEPPDEAVTRSAAVVAGPWAETLDEALIRFDRGSERQLFVFGISVDQCPQCRSRLRPKSKRCEACGFAINTDQRTCRRCTKDAIAMWCFDCDAYYCVECHERPHVLSLSGTSAPHHCFPIEGASGKMLGKGAWADELLAETKDVFRLRKSEKRGLGGKLLQQTGELSPLEPLRTNWAEKEGGASTGTAAEGVASSTSAAASDAQPFAPPFASTPEQVAARTAVSQSSSLGAVHTAPASSATSAAASTFDGTRVQASVAETRKRKLPPSESSSNQDNAKEPRSTQTNSATAVTPLVDRIHRVSQPEMSLYEQVRRMHDKRQQRGADHHPPSQPPLKHQSITAAHLPMPTPEPRQQTKNAATATAARPPALNLPEHRSAAAQPAQVDMSANATSVPTSSSQLTTPSTSPVGMVQYLQQQHKLLQRVVTGSATAAMTQSLQLQQNILQRAVTNSVTPATHTTTQSSPAQPLPQVSLPRAVIPAISSPTVSRLGLSSTTTPSVQSGTTTLSLQTQPSNAAKIQQPSRDNESSVPVNLRSSPPPSGATTPSATVDLTASSSASASTKAAPTKSLANQSNNILPSVGADEDALLVAVLNDYNAINTYVLNAERTIQDMAKAVRGLSFQDVAKAAKLNEAITEKRLALNEAKARRTKATARVMMYLPAVSNFARGAKPGDWGDVPQVLTASHARLATIASEMAALEQNVKNLEKLIDDAVNSGDMQRIQQVPELGTNIKKEQQQLDVHRSERDSQFVLMIKFSRELREAVQREVAALQQKNEAAMKASERK